MKRSDDIRREEVFNWLKENCRDISVLWRMRYSGIISPRDKHVIISRCLHLREEDVNR